MSSGFTSSTADDFDILYLLIQQDIDIADIAFLKGDKASEGDR